MKKHSRWILLLLPVLFLGGFLRWQTQQPEYVLRRLDAHQRKPKKLLSKGFEQYSDRAAEQHLKALLNWRGNKALPTLELIKTEQQPVPLLLWVSWYTDKDDLISGRVDIKGGFQRT